MVSKKKTKSRVFDFGTFYRVFDYVFEGLGFNDEVMVARWGCGDNLARDGTHGS